jgi:hypothetical protein
VIHAGVVDQHVDATAPGRGPGPDALPVRRAGEVRHQGLDTVAVRRQARGYALRVEAYRKDYRDLRPRYESLFDPLSLVPELRWDRVRIAPEAALTRRSAEPWNGWLSYTWARVRDDIDGTDIPRSWDQTHSVGGAVVWARDP